MWHCLHSNEFASATLWLPSFETHKKMSLLQVNISNEKTCNKIGFHFVCSLYPLAQGRLRKTPAWDLTREALLRLVKEMIISVKPIGVFFHFMLKLHFDIRVFSHANFNYWLCIAVIYSCIDNSSKFYRNTGLMKLKLFLSIWANINLSLQSYSRITKVKQQRHTKHS